MQGRRRGEKGTIAIAHYSWSCLYVYVYVYVYMDLQRDLGTPSTSDRDAMES